MSEAVTAALITGGMALAGTFLTVLGGGRLMNYRLDELKEALNLLREQVNAHNDLLARMTAVEEAVKSAHRRIDELREER